MVRIEYIKRLGWPAAGAALAAIALPTAATAAGLTFTGIEGTSGHKANVTTAGQLLTTQATPSRFVSSSVPGPGEHRDRRARVPVAALAATPVS